MRVNGAAKGACFPPLAGEAPKAVPYYDAGDKGGTYSNCRNEAIMRGKINHFPKRVPSVTPVALRATPRSRRNFPLGVGQ